MSKIFNTEKHNNKYNKIVKDMHNDIFNFVKSKGGEYNFNPIDAKIACYFPDRKDRFTFIEKDSIPLLDKIRIFKDDRDANIPEEGILQYVIVARAKDGPIYTSNEASYGYIYTSLFQDAWCYNTLEYMHKPITLEELHNVMMCINRLEE